MRVCVFGAGAIGVFLAGHLARVPGCVLSVVARGRNHDAIAAHGLRVITPEGEIAARVRVTSDPRELGVQDAVFLTLKAQQLDAALPQLAPLIGPQTCIVPPTTGLPYCFFYGAPGPHRDRRLDQVDPGGRQWEALPPSQAIGCVYWIGAHLRAPGVAVQDGARAGAPLGEFDGSLSSRVKALAEVLRAGGIRAPVRDDIRGEIWVKFVNSLCWNPVALLTRARLGEMADAPGLVDVVTAMMREADAVGAALGISIPSPPDRRIATTLSAPMHRMSMLQDLDDGRPLELEPLQRSLAAAASLSGHVTPTLATVLSMAALRERVATKEMAS